MLKSRVLWLIGLLGILLVMICSRVPWMIYLLTGYLSASAISVLAAILCMGKIGMHMEETERQSICIQADSYLLPMVRAHFLIRVRNQLTGDEDIISGELNGFHLKAAFSIQSRYCGLLTANMETVRISDWMGLISVPRKAEQRVAFLQLPDTYVYHPESGVPSLLDLDGSCYAPDCPGFDPSEIFSIREYKEGDPVRSIHWKLSSKTGTVFIREGSLPVKISILLLMETCFKSGEEEDWKEWIHRNVQKTLSAAETLLDEGKGCRIGWWDNLRSCLQIHEITNTEQLSGILGLLLSAAPQKSKTGILQRSEQEERLREFSCRILIDEEKENEKKKERKEA